MDVQYRILEHPADLGIEAWGKNIGEAFENAVLGLISTLVDPVGIDKRETKSLLLSATDYEGILVRLLSEVLYLYDGEGFLTSRADIRRLTPTMLEGQLAGETFDERKHTPKLDVKAITYHQISVQERSDGARVVVFLDI